MFAKGPQWDERRLAFERLHEVRLDRLLQEHGHRAGGAQLLSSDALAVVGVADRDRTESLTQVLQVRRDGGDRHHFGCRSDVEARLSWVAVRLARPGRVDSRGSGIGGVFARPRRRAR